MFSDPVTSKEWEKCEHTHTHSLTPGKVQLPSNTKPWLFVQREREGERERERERGRDRHCEGVFVCVWLRHKRGSCQRQRATAEERSTCQSG